MPQFLVVGSNDSKLGPAVEAAYPDDNIKAWPGVYIVSDDEAVLAKSVNEKIGIQDGKLGQAMVSTIGGYSGWAPKTVWEFLATKGTPHHGS